MIIVAGHLKIRNGKRDEFLSRSKDAVMAARRDTHCLAFNVTADLIESNQVCIFERWKSKKSLERFRGDGPGDDLSSLIVSAEIEEYIIKT